MNIEERVSRLQSLINEGRIIRARWSALDEAAWRRVEVVARRASVVEAMRHTTDERVLDACRGVLVWLDADMPESSRTAVVVAAAAAAGIWGSSRTAVVAAAGSSRTAVVAAAGAAAQAAQAAGAAAQVGAGAAAWAAAADRIIDAILSVLEKECGL
jgi:hypothetical protein